MPQRPPASGQKDHDAECKTRAPANTTFHPTIFFKRFRAASDRESASVVREWDRNVWRASRFRAC